MKRRSKIQFSPAERAMLREVEFFYGKKRMTEKIFVALSELKESIQATAQFDRLNFPPGTDVISGKISKGENYLGLPFVILDFPRLFTKEKICAFRTMVWWGKFISASFIYTVENERHEKQLLKKLQCLKGHRVYFCIAASPWLHQLLPENDRPLDQMNHVEIRQQLRAHRFIKVTRKIPPGKIGGMNEFATESFLLFAQLL